MVHNICKLADLNINMRDIYISMGYKNEIPEKKIKDIISSVYFEIDKISEPEYLYVIYDGNVESNISIKIAGEYFNTGKIITSYLEGANRYCVFVTTAGKKFEEYINRTRDRGDQLKEFITDSIGSVIAETCVKKISEELLQLMKDDECSYPYSPGYCGWSLSEQHKLFSLLPDKPCNIALTDACLMIPLKSVSGIIALGDCFAREGYGCDICNMKNCYKKTHVKSQTKN
jgi:hypothetical protein